MIFLIYKNIIKTGQRYTIQIQFNTIQYRSIPFNTVQYRAIPFNTVQYRSIPFNTVQYRSIPFNAVQYRSIPFNTIEDIKGKFVGINGTLNCKITNECITIENLKYRSVPLRTAMVIEFAYDILTPFNTVQYHSVSTVLCWS